MRHAALADRYPNTVYSDMPGIMRGACTVQAPGAPPKVPVTELSSSYGASLAAHLCRRRIVLVRLLFITGGIRLWGRILVPLPLVRVEKLLIDFLSVVHGSISPMLVETSGNEVPAMDLLDAA